MRLRGATMEDFKGAKVPVTLHLTAEAAEILNQYASERNKGRFVSALLLAQREAATREVANVTPSPAPSSVATKPTATLSRRNRKKRR
jgi:hypothetical protein